MRKARPGVPGAGLLRLRSRGHTVRPYSRVSVLLFRRSAPSRSLTATLAVMVNGSLTLFGVSAVLTDPSLGLITG
jgi:hypothetical protein